VPTYERSPQFVRDYESLSPDQRRAFRAAVTKFIEDLAGGKGFRAGLRVKGIRGVSEMFEMTWAADGRAVFSYGKSVVEDEPHIVWHAVGAHDVLGRS
jgi:hypothetical protein